jgi:hypothetical protein
MWVGGWVGGCGSWGPYRMGWARFASQLATARASPSKFVFSFKKNKKNNQLIDLFLNWIGNGACVKFEVRIFFQKNLK